MPGDYGPGGKWIHDRAHGIMEDGKTPKHIAYAIATQQAHKVGKSPKDFRTPTGVHEAKEKYDEPKSHYQKTASGRISPLNPIKASDVLKRLGQKVPEKVVENVGSKRISPLAHMMSPFGKTSSAEEVKLAAFFSELEKMAGPAFEAALQEGGGRMTDAAHAIGHGEWLKQQAAKKNLGTIMNRYGRAGGSAAKPATGFLSRLFH